MSQDIERVFYDIGIVNQLKKWTLFSFLYENENIIFIIANDIRIKSSIFRKWC